MKDKMHTGELYLPGDEEIMRHQLKRLDRLYDFNMTRPTELKKREEMLREMFAEIGDDCYIEPPFHSNFGGEHVHFGNHIYANFGLTLVDDTHIYVGDNTMFGPHVTVPTSEVDAAKLYAVVAAVCEVAVLADSQELGVVDFTPYFRLLTAGRKTKQQSRRQYNAN